MNIIRHCRPTVGKLLLIAVAAFLQPASGARLVEDTFDVLQTRTGTYTNVTVTTRAEDYIFILHKTGMTSIKLGDLPREIREQLGFALSPAERPQKTNAIASVAAREFSQVNKNLKPFQDMLKQKWQANRPPIKIGAEVVYTALGLALLGYIFFCYCCHLICVKSGNPPNLLVWLPGLQFVPLLRAAGMSGWWFFAGFVPLLNLVVHVMWSLNIVKTRGKSKYWAFLLILPGTNLLAFLYLAFSRSSPPEVPSPKFQTRAFQTA